MTAEQALARRIASVAPPDVAVTIRRHPRREIGGVTLDYDVELLHRDRLITVPGEDPEDAFLKAAAVLENGALVTSYGGEIRDLPPRPTEAALRDGEPRNLIDNPSATVGTEGWATGEVKPASFDWRSWDQVGTACGYLIGFALAVYASAWILRGALAVIRGVV